MAGASVAYSAIAPPGAFAQRPDGPNVLVIVIDTLRADHVGAYGGRAQTPSIDALAKERLRFTRIVQWVREFLASGGHYWEDDSRSWAARVCMAGAAVIAEAARRRPFALVVDTYEPHEPWTPPRAYVDVYGDPEYRGPEPSVSRYSRVKDYLKPDRREPVLSRMRDLYAAELTMTDRWLAVLLEALRAHGLEKETIVVLVADHGYLVGDHGWTGKNAGVLHPPLTHVPLILVDPRRRRAGATSDWFVQTHDVGPTLLDMANVKRPEPMNGTSVAPLLAGRQPRTPRPMAYGGYANWHYARTERWAYVAANTGLGRRLYDAKRDPEEHHNIARTHPNVIDELEERVREQAGGRLPSYDSRGRLRRR